VETIWLNDRRYLLFRPDIAGHLSAARPVVIFLPGTGGTAEWAADEARLPAFAAANGFLLAVPEALPPDPTRPPKFLTNPPRWNDGSRAPTPELQTDTDDSGFLAAVISDAIDRGPADPRRVYVAGFSNGAGMAFRLAAEHADRLAAVAPVAGYFAAAAQPSRPVPTLYLIGTADPLIPLRGGEVRLPWGNRLLRRPPVAATLERWAAAIGCDTHSQLESDVNGVRVEVFPPQGQHGAEFRVVTVAGLGHHWPGGKGQLNPRIGGPPSDRIDANQLIWDFFRRQTL
jgi:polyhydroxybutyrate depolymerase